MAELIYHPEAEAEIRRAAAWYESRRDGLGRSFLRELDRAVQLVRSSPQTWRQIQGRFRRVLLKGFPYAVIYVADPRRITIIAVAHLKQRPGYWSRRRP